MKGGTQLHVTDYEGNEYILQATSTNDGDLNGNQSVSVSIKSSKVNDLFINDIDKLWTITDLDNVEHKIIYLNKKGSGDKLNVEIRGIPLFFHELDNDRIYEAYNEHMTAHLAFTRIFADTGFTFALVDSFNAIQWEGFGGGETKLETFKRAINRYGAEFEIVGNIVYLKKLIGNDTNHMYRHRLNASNITQEIDAGNIWTYAKGYADYGDGEGGEDWQDAKLTSEYTSPLASILGVLHAPPIKNGNIKDKNTLDQQLKTLVDESLKISVTADIHDLQKQGYPIAQSQLGDRVFLIDERIGLDDEVRVVNKSITRDWDGRVLDLNLTFGTESITKRHMSNINTAIKDINAVLSGTKKIPFSAYDEAVINATNALQRMQSQLEITNNGSLLAVDKDNPNNVVILNAAGLGVSKDGGSSFGYAITGDGINGEYIIAKTVTADQLNVNRLSQVSNATGKLEVTDDILLTEVNKGIFLSYENLDEPSGGAISRLMAGNGRLNKHHLRYDGRFKEDNEPWRNATTIFGMDHALFREYIRNSDGTNGQIRYRTDITAKEIFMVNAGSGASSYNTYSKLDLDGLFIKNFAQEARYRANMIKITGTDFWIESDDKEFFQFTKGEGQIIRSRTIYENQQSTSGGVPVYITTGQNVMYVATSSERFKINIDRGEKDTDLNLLNVPVARWNDKKTIETYADLLTDEHKGNKVDWDRDERAKSVESIDKSVGFIAEDLYDLGLVDYLVFTDNRKRREDILTIQYDRLVVPLLAIVQRQQSEINEIKERLNEKAN